MSDKSSGRGSSGNISGISDSELELNMIDLLDNNGHFVDSDPDPDSDRVSDDSGDGGSGAEADVDGGLDSEKSEEPFYFEGVEKLLEIWFTRQDGKMGDKCSLRNITR
ncbi:S-adenosylmethionine decarboxylase proenzyme [Orchesella cincta]|uniref:S-adenosylmethionine decarboxylase proenzyme n=1 Tax=Orchesella cincta TaxID=48709 RepID=A0A1D2MJW0_ORCCI|nr:S-adenosylmethionine decarboxylase proenzyme [Orchesella cincta]